MICEQGGHALELYEQWAQNHGISRQKLEMERDSLRMAAMLHDVGKIAIYGRIVALADVYDALSSARVYKEAWDESEVLSTIEKESGRQFDPELVEIFFSRLNILRAIQERYIFTGIKSVIPSFQSIHLRHSSLWYHPTTSSFVVVYSIILLDYCHIAGYR